MTDKSEDVQIVDGDLASFRNLDGSFHIPDDDADLCLSKCFNQR